MTTRRTFLQLAGSLAATATATAIAAEAEPKPGQKRIKVGQIGTRHAHASGKMSTLRKFSNLYEVVGVVEPDEQRRRQMEQQPTYRGVTWMSEEALLNVPGLEAVAVETEVRQLMPTAIRCAEAGLHLHVDKPAGESIEPLAKLLKLLQQKNKVLQMGYMFRYNPGFQLLFESIRAGLLGDLFEAHGVMSKTVNAATRQQLAAYKGGTMFELGCHLIDAVVTALGTPQKVTSFTRRTRPEQDTLADNQLAVFEYPEATATIRSSLMEVHGGRRRQLVVCGDRGTLAIRPLEPAHVELTLAEPAGRFQGGTQTVELVQPKGRYDGDFLDLAKVIRGEKELAWKPEHDLAVQKCVLAASGIGKL